MGKHPEKGIALITTLMIVVLMLSITAGLIWLVIGDERLGGNNSDHELAFYGAESGLEALTAELENTFDSNYAPTSTAISSVVSGTPLNLVPGVQYLSPGSTTNGSGLSITFPPISGSNPNPLSSYHTIATGAYAGLVGLTTPYTLTAISHTSMGSEVKLVRQVQTVGIPIFQFGIFCNTDCSFFAGPNFNFGGRVHSNGNLWLAEGNGTTLTMANKVTAVGEIITSNLENGWLTSSNYNGAVNITTNPGSSSYADITAQTPYQSALGTTNYINNVGAYDTTFGSMASSVFNNNVAVGPENNGVTTLNMAIATPAIGGQPIDIIRRPIAGENTSNPGKLAERYYSQVSVRILLSDYGPSGGCTDSDISSTSSSALPGLATNGTTPTTPVDLASLAWTSTGPPAGNGNTTLPYSGPPSWLTSANVGVSVFPLPASNAQGGASYTATDGYWVKRWYPIITGCIKIDEQSNTTPSTWTDVTAEILQLGWTGRNINPQVNHNGVSSPPANPWLEPNLATEATGVNGNSLGQLAASGPTANSGVTIVGCTDPSPNAIIRLARLRDNPSNAAGGTSSASNNFCGNNPSSNGWSGLSANQSSKNCSGSSNTLRDCATTLGTDFWPLALYDTREGLLTDSALGASSQVTLAGTMYYVELDVANLDKWFAGTIGSTGSTVNNTTGYSVYFSDRRSEKQDPSPPPSVGTSSMLTGGYGFDDFVNPASASGCPNNTLDQGEDVESDYVNGVSSYTGTTPRTYGKTPAFDNAGSASVSTIATITTTAGPLGDNPNCAGNVTSPYATADQTDDLRENPALIFRRSLKLVDGSTISIGSTTCNGVACGLTVIAENPIYVQGDYNNPGLSTTFTGTGVGASVIGDAVTFLSDGWNDFNSFAFPYSPGNRAATDTTYRMAVIGSAGIPFKQPTVGGPPQDFGTDGGTHNFLRYLESWTNLYYTGSIVNMYYNHQAVGTYKCCTTVYNPPNRVYNFDSNFLTPSLLPPLTPMLRALNTLTFTQDMLPTQ